LTSSTTTAFSGDFAEVFGGSLEEIIGALALGTFAPVFLALQTISYFCGGGVFGGAGFIVCNSYTNYTIA